MAHTYVSQLLETLAEREERQAAAQGGLTPNSRPSIAVELATPKPSHEVECNSETTTTVPALLPPTCVSPSDSEASNPFSSTGPAPRSPGPLANSACDPGSTLGADPLGGFASGCSRRSSRFVLRLMSPTELEGGDGIQALNLNTDLLQSLAVSRRDSVAMPGTGNIGVVDPDKVFVCAARYAFDASEMDLLDVESFLCVAKDVKPAFPDFANPDHCLHIPLMDNAKEQLAPHIPAVLEFIDRELAAGRRVVIYCQAGRSRSVSMSLVYLMKTYHIDVATALQELRLGYKTADPNPFFLMQLEKGRIVETADGDDESWGELM